MKAHLVTFADGPFSTRLYSFLAQAESMELFDTIKTHSFSTLQQDFQAQHAEFVNANRRGFGFWVWKSQAILEALESADSDDCIIYLDAGYTLNPKGRDRFLEYLEITCDSRHSLLSFQNIHTEAYWTKADLPARLGLKTNGTEMKTSQLTANFMILRPAPDNFDFVRLWQQISIEKDYHYLNDSPSEIPNHPLFREHRHDQSISSLIRKMRGSEITHLETQSYEGYFDKYKNSLPCWATRSKT
ncbi:hypothetical protein [Thalassovita gelatinovora]|nr:hypothetical protein [Thalassovita gelatinovora]QIZ80942.1 hypothetical protein HFZ77_10890 [Thalassovita gelatinovora]